MTSEFRLQRNSSPCDRYYRFSYRQLRLTDSLRLTRPRLTNDTDGNGLPFLSPPPPLPPAPSTGFSAGFYDGSAGARVGERNNTRASRILWLQLILISRRAEPCTHTRSLREKHAEDWFVSLCTIISNAQSSILVRATLEIAVKISAWNNWKWVKIETSAKNWLICGITRSSIFVMDAL